MNEKICNNADYILRMLELEGLQTFFMVPGKLINPLMSRYNMEISHAYSIKPVTAAHEAGAAAMADGYARASGHIGVCMAIDGPGTMNAIPMLAAAQADSSPVLLISGHIPRDFQGMGAIQDTTQSGISTVDMLKSLCNSSISVSHSKNLPHYLKTTFQSMLGLPKGTGYVSIAKDVLLEKAKESPLKAIRPYNKLQILDHQAIKNFAENYLKENSKIAILVGSFCKSESLYKKLKLFSEKYAVPVATTISSKSFFDEEHSNFLGIFGYSGHKRAHDTLLSEDVDLIILLGFDVTQWTTLAWHEDFIKKKLIQVDKNPMYISKFIDITEGIVADEEEFLDYLMKEHEPLLKFHQHIREDWLKKIRRKPLYEQNLGNLNNEDIIHPAHIVITARDIFPKDTIAVADAGVHRSYATHYWKTYGYQQFFAATTFAPMGWAVPASIGIKIAKPNQKVVVFTGDGCMLMSGMEIQTAAKLNLDITFIVFNNGYYGASYFNNMENEPSLTQIPQHNWAKVAEGLGARGFQAKNYEDLADIYNSIREMPGTKLIDIICNHEVRAPSMLYSSTLKTRPFM